MPKFCLSALDHDLIHNVFNQNMLKEVNPRNLFNEKNSFEIAKKLSFINFKEFACILLRKSAINDHSVPIDISEYTG